jgi:hypothetical protein
MKIESLLTSSLVPYALNAKKHDPDQIAKIAGSIREYGFNNPVLVDAAQPPGIIAGHGRVLAARHLGLEEVPCICLGHLSETQKRAYILADNRLAEIGGGWDQELLLAELTALGDADIDLDALGFGEDFDFGPAEEEKAPDGKDLSDLPEKHELIIECKNEEEQEKAFNYAKEGGFKCRISTF